MRKSHLVTVLSTVLLAGFASGLAAAAPTARSTTGTIVIVFKDGHRQTFKLADIERVEFPAVASASAESPGTQVTPRGRFFGKWEVGDGAGSTFFITLKESGEARRSIGNMHGRWEYVNGDALITWDDGWHDAIRKVGSHFQKFAYAQPKTFSDEPDNVTDAHSTSQRPI